MSVRQQSKKLWHIQSTKDIKQSGRDFYLLVRKDITREKKAGHTAQV